MELGEILSFSISAWVLPMFLQGLFSDPVVQCSAKRWSPDLARFVPAVLLLTTSALILTAAFTQPGDRLLADRRRVPCSCLLYDNLTDETSLRSIDVAAGDTRNFLIDLFSVS